MTGAGVEAEEMRVIGEKEDAVVPESDATVVVESGVIDKTFRNRARVVPDGATGACVERVGIIRRSNEHDAFENGRSDFEVRRATNVKNPFRTERRDLCRRDLIQGAEATAGVVAIIRGPIDRKST